MKNSLKLDYGGLLAIVMLSLGFALACGGVAQAAPQYAMDCNKCHAMPPKDSHIETPATPEKKDPFTGAVPGRHQTHATAAETSCAVCHNNSGYGNSHRNKVIDFKDSIGYGRKPLDPGFMNQTSVPPNPLATCSTAACHSNGKGVNRVTPAWSSTAPATCDTCHDSQPSTNKHGTHLAYYGGPDACVKCHSNHTTFAHATSAMWGRAIDVRFATAPNTSGTFTPNVVQANASCSALYCHSNGQTGGAQVFATPTWGGSATCASCHGDATADTLSGKHAKHVNNAVVLGSDYGCVQCHSATVSNNTTIADKAKHVDGNKDVSAACSSCHQDGKGTDKSVGLDWNGAATLDCKGCHGANGTSIAGEPDYANTSAGDTRANSHGKHVTGAADCVNCHSKTTTNGTSIIANNQHTDGFINYTAGNGKTFNKLADKTCSNISCHSGGGIVQNVGNAQWGATLDCQGCHSTLSTSHSAHTGIYGCLSCHSDSVTDSTHIKAGGLHMNSAINVAGATFTSVDVAAHTCATSCHMSATPNWTQASSGQCGTCHAATSPLISTNAHAVHFTATKGPGLTQDVAGCQVCHTYTGERTSTHSDGAKNLNGGFAVNGACGTCHKQTSTQWATAASVTCESCHSTAGGALSVISGVTAPDKTAAASSGHGKTGIAQSCNVCHNTATAHISGTLGDSNRIFANYSGSAGCNFCHDNHTTVPTASKQDMKVHRPFGEKGNKCADCHDPHGTAPNTMMVNKTINGTAVSFTGNNTFANGGNNGVCQVCHTATDYFKADGSGSTHVDSTQNCLECHSHNPAAGFAFMANGACDSCHGYPPAPRKLLGGADQTLPVAGWDKAKYENYSGGGGAHLVAAHVPQGLVLTGTDADWAPCLPCHADGKNSHNRALPLRNNVENVSVKIEPQYRFSDVSFATYTSETLASAGANKTGRCFNVSCHFKTTDKWSIER